MAKRLSPKRRRAMRQRLAHLELVKALNPTTQTDAKPVGYDRSKVRKHAGLALALQGSSRKLSRGLLHKEADRPAYAQHKRRKPSKPAAHVNPADVEVIVQPHTIADDLPREAIPAAVPHKRVSRPDRVLPKGKKMFSEPGKGELITSSHRTPPGVWGTKIDDGN